MPEEKAGGRYAARDWNWQSNHFHQDRWSGNRLSQDPQPNKRNMNFALSALLLLGVIRGGTGEESKVFEKVGNSAHFIRLGSAILTEETADLIYDVSL